MNGDSLNPSAGMHTASSLNSAGCRPCYTATKGPMVRPRNLLSYRCARSEIVLACPRPRATGSDTKVSVGVSGAPSKVSPLLPQLCFYLKVIGEATSVCLQMTRDPMIVDLALRAVAYKCSPLRYDRSNPPYHFFQCVDLNTRYTFDDRMH